MIRAFLTVNTVPDKIEQVLRDIQKIEGVKQTHMVYGIYDVISEVQADNIDDLRSLILKIRKMPNVFHLLVQIVRKEERIKENHFSVSNIHEYSSLPRLNVGLK